MVEDTEFLNEQLSPEDSAEDAKVWPQSWLLPINLHKVCKRSQDMATFEGHSQKEGELWNAAYIFADFGNTKWKLRNSCVTFNYS